MMKKRPLPRRSRVIGELDLMGRLGICAFVAAASGLACGTAVRASADWDRAADLAPSKTFSVARSPLLPKELTPEQVKLVEIVESTTRRELARKGYLERPLAQAQLVATSHFTTRDRARTTTTTCDNYWEEAMYEGAMLPGGAVAPCQDTMITQFEESVLFIDIYDTRLQQLVWHGWATGQKPESGDSGTPELVQRATLDILERFPP